MKKFQLFLSFYKSIAVASIAITIGALSIIYIHGIDTFIFVFWFKNLTLFFILYANNSYKRDEYFYYLNLGIPKKHLWISSALFDIFIFIILLIIILKIR